AAIQRSACCWIACHGGKSCGSIRHGHPARTMYRSPLKSTRSGYFLCGASSFISVRYGAQNAHSSSVASLGYVFRWMYLSAIPSVMQGCVYKVQTFLPIKVHDTLKTIVFPPSH